MTIPNGPEFLMMFSRKKPGYIIKLTFKVGYSSFPRSRYIRLAPGDNRPHSAIYRDVQDAIDLSNLEKPRAMFDEHINDIADLLGGHVVDEVDLYQW